MSTVVTVPDALRTVPPQRPRIAVVAADLDTLPSDTARLIRQCGLPHLRTAPSDGQTYPNRWDYLLHVRGTLGELIATGGQHGPVTIDFTGGRLGFRRRHGGGRQQTLPRAIGLHRRAALNVVDATAGFGTDAFILASLGASVTLIEREPTIAVLLQQALMAARHHPETAAIANRMLLVYAEAAAWLAQVTAQAPENPFVWRSVAESRIDRPDVVYLDPMYPHDRKHALPSKNMQYLQVVAGPDHDSADLLEAALGAARLRVVVKRPRHAPVLNGRPPSRHVVSVNTRYDIYTVSALR